MVNGNTRTYGLKRQGKRSGIEMPIRIYIQRSEIYRDPSKGASVGLLPSLFTINLMGSSIPRVVSSNRPALR